MKQKFTAMAAEYLLKEYMNRIIRMMVIAFLWIVYGQEVYQRKIAHIDCWLKEIAPTDELRKWFAHDPAKWNGFIKKYKEEIEQNRQERNC
jgi:hypothetical protein